MKKILFLSLILVGLLFGNEVSAGKTTRLQNEVAALNTTLAAVRSNSLTIYFLKKELEARDIQIPKEIKLKADLAKLVKKTLKAEIKEKEVAIAARITAKQLAKQPAVEVKPANSRHVSSADPIFSDEERPSVAKATAGAGEEVPQKPLSKKIKKWCKKTVKKAWQGTKNLPGQVAPALWTGAKWTAGKTWDGTKWVINAHQWMFENTYNAVSDPIGTYNYIKNGAMNVGKIAVGVAGTLAVGTVYCHIVSAAVCYLLGVKDYSKGSSAQ